MEEAVASQSLSSRQSLCVPAPIVLHQVSVDVEATNMLTWMEGDLQVRNDMHWHP